MYVQKEDLNLYNKNCIKNNLKDLLSILTPFRISTIIPFKLLNTI